MSPLRQDNVTTDAEGRLRNILLATATETGDMADLVRWLVANLQHARRHLRAVELAEGTPRAVRVVASAGLELIGDE